MRGRDHGFTLIEILVVLAIMGAVIGIGVMRGPVTNRGLQTRAAAGLLAQTLREARAQAIERSRIVNVAIDPVRRNFAADGGPVHIMAPDMQVAVLPPALKGPGDVRVIRFAPDGSASGGGIVLGSGTRRVKIDIEWLTGRVQVANAP
jgi:general secretion pathway protein H